MENLRGGFISDFNGRGTIFENFYFLSFLGSGRYSIGSGSKCHAKVGYRRVRSSCSDPVYAKNMFWTFVAFRDRDICPLILINMYIYIINKCLGIIMEMEMVFISLGIFMMEMVFRSLGIFMEWKWK